MANAAMTVTAHLSRATYSGPPSGQLGRDATVEMMFDRLCLYRAGRTTLADAGNYCLSALEYAAGGRKRAASRYNVAKTIFNRLGELAGEKGGKERAGNPRCWPTPAAGL